MFATYVFSATSTCCSDDLRLIDAELDAMERRAAPVEKAALVDKAAGEVENAAAGGWPVERKDGG
jgi:hypothetical protein